MNGDANLYVWIKAVHVIAVIAWMAGLLYLPRLFVYHAGAAAGSPMSETFKVMERRLYYAITLPAMIATLLLGLALAGLLGSGAAQGWLAAKLALVLGLLAFTHLLGRWRKRFEQDRNTHTVRFFRMINEVPTVLMIGIVILVVVKPF
jgi:putative membrane protein